MEERVNQKDDLNNEIMLDAAGAGVLFGVSKWAIYKKVKNEGLPSHKKGKRIYFFKSELIKYIMES